MKTVCLDCKGERLPVVTAARLAQTASVFDGTVRLVGGKTSADGKQLLELLDWRCDPGQRPCLEVEGHGEEDMAEGLHNLLHRCGEEGFC